MQNIIQVIFGKYKTNSKTQLFISMPSSSDSSSHHRHHSSSHHHRHKPAQPIAKPVEEIDSISVLTSNASQLKKVFFNSIFIFIAAYFLVDAFYQLITWALAINFGIPCKMAFGGIILPEEHIKWTPAVILSVYLIPLVVVAFLGIIWRWMINKTKIDELVFNGLPKVLKWKNKLHENTGNGKVFYMWIFFHSISLIFTSLAVMLFSHKGIGNLLSKIEIELSIKIALAVFFLFLLANVGKYNVKLILRTSFSKRIILPESRKYFIAIQAIMPWMIGIIVIWLLHIPNMELTDSLKELIVMGSIFILMFSKPKKVLKINLYKGEKPLEYVSAVWFAVLILFVIAFRFALPYIYQH